MPGLMTSWPGPGHQTHPAGPGDPRLAVLTAPPAPQTPARSTQPPPPKEMPPPEEPDTEAVPGINAEWVRQHAERVGMLLSLPENDISFTVEEVQTAVKTSLMGLEMEPGKIDVASRGRTGPYEVTLTPGERDAILRQGDIDIFQHTGDEERTFNVYETDEYGKVVQSEEQAKAEFNESERAERLQRNKREAEDRKGTQLRIFLDGTSQSASLEESKRKEFLEAAMQKLKTIFDARCRVKPDRMALVAVTDAFGNEMNKGVIFINLPKTVDGAEWAAAVRWDAVKYIHMGDQLLPVKIRMDKRMLAATGLKQCCFLPGCREIPCPAMRDAYDRAGCSRAKRGFREHEPSWEQEKAQRRQDTADKIGDAKKKAEAAMARQRERPCKQWLGGRCFKDGCARKHGTAEETSMIDCSHGTACNRTKCPYRHGAEEQQP